MIYEYLLSMINKATGGSTKQLGRTFLRERENNGWLYLEGMFCPTVAVKLVKPYIILTFLSTAAVRKSSQKGFFCVQGVSHRKTSHLNYVVSICQKFCFGLRRAKSPKTQRSKVARIPLFFALCRWMALTACDYWWQCVNAWLHTATNVIQRAACKRKRCQSWHKATSNCLPKALRVSSPDSFPDKSVLSLETLNCVMEVGGPTQVTRGRGRWRGHMRPSHRLSQSQWSTIEWDRSLLTQCHQQTQSPLSESAW